MAVLLLQVCADLTIVLWVPPFWLTLISEIHCLS